MTSEAFDNTTDVETPERIAFRYHVAGPTRRALAWFLDLVIRGAALLVIAVLTTAFWHPFASAVAEGATSGLALIFFFLLEWAYPVLFEAFAGGRTPGKRALRLRVVKDGGYPLGFLDAVLRNLLRAADFMPVGYVLGIVVMAGDRRFRRLGDHVAGTMVVVEDPIYVMTPLALDPPATATELGALPHRPRVSPSELEAIEWTLRRTGIAPARRIELADMIAPTLAQRMNLAYQDPVRFLALLHMRARGAATRSHA